MNPTSRQYLILHEDPWQARRLAARPRPAGIDFVPCARLADAVDLLRRPGAEAVLACHPFQGLGPGALAGRLKDEGVRVPVMLCRGAAGAREVMAFMQSGASMFLQWALQTGRPGADAIRPSRVDP